MGSQSIKKKSSKGIIKKKVSDICRI